MQTYAALRHNLKTALIAAFVVVSSLPAGAQSPNPATPPAPWMDRSLSPDQRADLVIARMTLDEKISLLHGGGWAELRAHFTSSGSPSGKSLGNAGYILGVARLGMPDLQMADAAVGVTHGAAFGRYCTALPSGTSEASSWDLALARAYGALIGRELRDQGYTMSLGGGIDLAREPRNGRIFEYKGEDPVLAGKMVGAEMKALQEQGVVGDLKHYALNDQETGRNYVNVKIGRRAMRESDLLAFEIGIKESGVGAVMCSYNLVNGDYACENNYLLNEVLKRDFGFQGFVLSDWGATHSVAKAALAGLDMEMPGNEHFGDALKKAVESGEVPVSRLDDMVHRIVRTEFAVGLFDNPSDRQAVDPVAGYAVAQRVAEEGSVLLKNARGQLPLSAARLKAIAVIGSHADVGVLSGGGSAQVDAAGGNAVPPPPGARGLALFGLPVWHRSAPLAAIRAKAAQAHVEFLPGTDASAAAKLAGNSDVAIVFVNQHTSEGMDVPSLSLPAGQDALVNAVAAANPHTVVVVESGGAITMPWIDKVNAVLEVWYPGIRGPEAIANLLFGNVNPSGKLALSFPQSESDLPHPEPFKQPAPGPGDIKPLIPGVSFQVNTRHFDIEYSEGLKVGYKWYDAEKKQPLFPFGFGLSYTTYAYSNLKIRADSSPTVGFTVKNIGARAGAEIAQVYATLPQAAGEPFKRLVAWSRIQLAPGEAKTVTLTLDPHLMSIFNADKDAWELIAGEYKLQVGGSSRSTPLTGSWVVRRK